MHRERYTVKYKETEELLEKSLVFKVALKENEVSRDDISPTIQKLSHEVVKLLCWDLPNSGIQFSQLDGSAKLTDVAKHLQSSEEAIISAAYSHIKDKVSIVIFQQISLEGSEVRIGAREGHGFPVFSLPGHELAKMYKHKVDFLEKKPCVQNGFAKERSPHRKRDPRNSKVELHDS